MDKEDLKYLDLLTIFHYVVAGVTALFGCFPIMHLIMGALIVSGAFSEQSNNPPPQFMGWFFIAIAAVMITFFWVLAAGMIIVGRNLKKRQKRMFCMIVAGIECLFMPFGTILGILTILFLNKDTVKSEFQD